MAIFDKISGISTGSGFKYQAEAPLDARLVVDSFSDLDELVKGYAAYEGMLVYVRNETVVGDITYLKGYYLCEDNDVEKPIWTYCSMQGGGSSDPVDTIKVKTDFGDGIYDVTITMSQDDPNAGNIGDIWFKY